MQIYGPNGTYEGGREKAPAALCRKIIKAIFDNNETIDVWGDGNQTRSFCYVDELVEGILRLMATEKGVTGPMNLGNPIEYTILEIAEIVINQTGSKSKIIFKTLPEDDPKQRQPDISFAKSKLNWEPKTQLKEGLDKTIQYFDQTLSNNVNG